MYNELDIWIMNSNKSKEKTTNCEYFGGKWCGQNLSLICYAIFSDRNVGYVNLIIDIVLPLMKADLFL